MPSLDNLKRYVFVENVIEKYDAQVVFIFYIFDVLNQYYIQAIAWCLPLTSLYATTSKGPLCSSD